MMASNLHSKCRMFLYLLLSSSIFGCAQDGPSNCDGQAFSVNSSFRNVAHENIIELMRIDNTLLSTWGRDSSESEYFYPEHFICENRKDVTKQMIPTALEIDSIRTMVFFWV